MNIYYWDFTGVSIYFVVFHLLQSHYLITFILDNVKDLHEELIIL